jgi:hypothetical protein
MSDIELRHPVNALVSFHYFDKDNIAEMKSWGLNLIGDSGAFSAASQGTPIDIKQFADWASKWKESFSWVASLDVIGDTKASRKNYEWLRSKGLDVVPTIHYGSNPETITNYVNDGVDFVGLGGMVGFKGEPDRLLRWALRMFKYARDNHPEVRFHGWGVTHPKIVNSLPWFSVDSSGFSSAYRFARLSLFDPRTSKRVGINLDGKNIFNHSRLLRDVYKVDPSKVCTSNVDNRRDLVRLSVSSAQKLEDYLRKRHKVSCPTYGVSNNNNGTNVHFVDTYTGHFELMQNNKTGTKIHVANSSIKDHEALKGN